MEDVVDLSVKKSSASPLSNQARTPTTPKAPRLDLPILDQPRLEIPMPVAFNHIPPAMAGLIPQVQVPHDLTRLVSMLREREREEASNSATTLITGTHNRNSPMSTAALSTLLLPQSRLTHNVRKQHHVSSLKRKKQQEDKDVFQHLHQLHVSSCHPVRRSLRPRAERSYAESPDIVVDYEDEPPSKMNGIASINGNGYENDDEESNNSDYGEMPPLPVIKELSPEEVKARERTLEKLRENVRNEEMKLVLLKKLRQSQMMKENVSVSQSPNNSLTNSNNILGTSLSVTGVNSIGAPTLPPTHSPVHNTNHVGIQNLHGVNLGSGGKGRSSPKPSSGTNLSINPNHGTPAGHLSGLRLTQQGIPGIGLSPQQGNNSQTRHQHSSPGKGLNSSKVPSLLKGQQQPQQPTSRSGGPPNSHHTQSSIPPLMMPPQRSSSSSISHNLLLAQAQQSLLRGSRNQVPASASNMMLNFAGAPPGAIPPPTISPAMDKYERPKEAHSSSASSSQQAERRHRLATTGEEERETPAQRQAAAKLALRKQLEKTLLQIPPPKPPPPEMNFIPNPSNMEFLALIGLEFVVDYITKDPKLIPKYPEAVLCSQCNTDFSSMWKVDKGKIICEQCATSNAKKSLKAEHTNRLKTAFVQALQQEQEIEQRLAQGGSLTETLGNVGTSVRAGSTPSPNHTVVERDRRSPQVISSSTTSTRNRTPTQSPGLGNIPLALPVRDRDRDREKEREREREQREREREREREQREQREMREAISAITAAQQQQQQLVQKERERESHSLSSNMSGRDRGGSSTSRSAAVAAANESLNLSTHNQHHNFSQQIRHEMAQLAQLHEQQFQQQQLQQQLQQQQQQRHPSKGNSRGSSGANSSNLSMRGEKRERERGGEAYRLERDREQSNTASSILSQTLAQTMANQFMSHNIQNMSMVQPPSSSHSSSQKSSQPSGSSRRGPRNSDQSYKQPTMSKQQKLDAEAAAKFASAMGMPGATSGGVGLNPTAVAAALQAAAHQQMLRMPQNQQIPAHLFPSLLYPYQMAMAQAASASGKPLPQASLAELQRQAENLQQLQRQYLLDMIPNSRNLPQNWKT